MMKTNELPTGLMRVDMKSLGFITWDRFIVDLEEETVDLYGWIKREDKHEDFVVLNYKKIESGWTTSFSTSSKKHDKEIFKLLEGKGEPNRCERVEDFFDIGNMIKLKTSEKNWKK